MRPRRGYPPGVPCQPTGREALLELPPDQRPVEAGRGLGVAGIRSQSGSAAWDTWVAVSSADPSGAAFGIWEARGHRGAQAVNAPGTRNWSDLLTRDLEGSKAFYGAVFGWQADPVDLGGDDAAVWRLPGYGDFLEADDPDLRRRQADAGVPAGLADAIGWLLTPAGDDPPHWQVTSAVDDTDATVDLAVQLGAQILVPPYDAGPVRVALVGDPWCAVFPVSRYDH